MLLDIDVVVRQPLVLIAPVASPVLVLSSVLIAPTVSIASPVITAPTASTVPVASPVITAPSVSTVPKQLSPDRPEVLIQAYLAEKAAWLA